MRQVDQLPLRAGVMLQLNVPSLSLCCCRCFCRLNAEFVMDLIEEMSLCKYNGRPHWVSV